ncbi:MAG: type II toxin-antitoxin system VapC family toxin [Bryobacteraceae bacterium]
MNVLLDTNAFIRWMTGVPLPKRAERVIQKADTKIYLSVVSVWEIVMKPRLGISALQVEEAIHEMGAVLLPIRIRHLDELSRLPAHGDHKDPFDRVLISQALAEGFSVVSSDDRFPAYGRLAVLWD